MSLFSIDREKCNRDGICAAECPAKIIAMADDEGFPCPTAYAEELCIQCGHCVAVCPEGALSLGTMKSEACPAVQKELFVTAEQIEHLVRTRRSIRTFKKKGVNREIIKRLIDIARYAPTAKNLQPVHWLVIEDRTKLDHLVSIVIDWMSSMLKGEREALFPPLLMERIVSDWQKGEDRICRGAPQVIVAHGLKKLPAALSSCIIALTTLELTAPSFGLGACWGGYFNIAANAYVPMFQALGLPETHQTFGAMMIGFPKYSYHRIPLRKEAAITWR